MIFWGKKKYQYIDTKGYFKQSEIYKNLAGITPILSRHDRNAILEIGAYEGVGTCYLCDNFLMNPESFLTTVDPFLIDDAGTAMHGMVERNFLRNVSNVKFLDKLTYVKDKSANFFAGNQKTYNFIYVDGSHHPNDLMLDLKESIKVLEKNGILWIDDYGSNYSVNSVSPKDVVDEFYKSECDSLTRIHSGYQVAFKKL